MSKQQILDLDIVNFDPAHIEVAELTDHEEANFKRLPDSMQALYTLKKNSMQAVTVMLEGRILLMCGFIILWPGVAELWMIPTKRIEKNPVKVCKAVEQFINMVGESLKLHRLQAKCLDDQQHNSFMEFLGFTNEGRLDEYSDLKENYNHWRRLWPQSPQSSQ